MVYDFLFEWFMVLLEWFIICVGIVSDFRWNGECFLL